MLIFLKKISKNKIIFFIITIIISEYINMLNSYSIYKVVNSEYVNKINYSGELKSEGNKINPYLTKDDSLVINEVGNDFVVFTLVKGFEDNFIDSYTIDIIESNPGFVFKRFEIFTEHYLGLDSPKVITMRGSGLKSKIDYILRLTVNKSFNKNTVLPIDIMFRTK